METFVVNDKEHELKLTLKGVKYLNGLYDGGGFMLIQKAISGDIDTYVDVIFAGLMHTEEGYKRKTVEEAIDKAIEEERLDLDSINRTMYSIVVDSFFYKKTMEKLFQNDKDAKKQIEKLMK